jgi:hypothetical protein
VLQHFLGVKGHFDDEVETQISSSILVDNDFVTRCPGFVSCALFAVWNNAVVDFNFYVSDDIYSLFI